VCYDHDDAELVYADINDLHTSGLEIWYDEGISPGFDWSEEIAEKLQDCAVFLYFLSPHSATSQHCRAELNFALDQRCTVIVVHIDESALTPGMQLKLGTRQAILRYELRHEAYLRKLASGVEKVIERVSQTPSTHAPENIVAKALARAPELKGERKRISILSAELQDAGGLWALDPEISHAIVQEGQERLAAGIHRFEGTVNQYSSSGISGFFGAPIAHEDHAQRACYAALHIQEEIRRWANELRRTRGVSLALRIGIDSSEVVVGRVGDDLQMEHSAHGLAVSVAAAVEKLAEPGHTYVTSRIAALAEGFFELHDLGEFDLASAASKVNVYDLEGLGSARTRLDVARIRGLSQFVGRDDETVTLQSALDRVREGNGQVVGVVAPAGTGKSRLCVEFVDQCRRRGVAVFGAHCPAHGKTVPLLPILELLRHYFDIDPQDVPRSARERIAGRMLLLDPAFSDDLPLVFDLLGVADPNQAALRLDPDLRQVRLFAFMRRLVELHGQREPFVLLIDDLHWVDEASDRFVAELVEAASRSRMLLLVNFRPLEYSPAWSAKSYYHQLPLLPLSEAATGELIGHLLGRDPSLDGLPARIHAQTDGNPFFTEEVVQSLIEAGYLEGTQGNYVLASAIDTLEVPPNVQAVLQARIDRLDEDQKRLLQTAAVIGKEFDESLLGAIVDLDEAQLRAGLAHLAESEFLIERSIYPIAEYSFKHPQTHQVAEESQLREHRTQTHRKVAQALERLHASELDESAALLAYHWEGAGEPFTAAEWHQRAAYWIGLSDRAEGARHWQRIRELGRDFADDEGLALVGEACYQFLNVGWRVNVPLDERRDALEVGRRAASTVGDDALLVRVLSGFSACLCVLDGNFSEGFSISEEALALAKSTGDPEVEIHALVNHADNLLFPGDLRPALADFQRIIELTKGDAGILNAGDQGALGMALLQSSGVRGELGEHVAARADFERSLRLSEDSGRDEDILLSLSLGPPRELLAGYTDPSIPQAERAFAIGEILSVAGFRYLGIFKLGMVLAGIGDPDQAIRRLDECIALDVLPMLNPLALAAMAEAHMRAGRPEEATAPARRAVELAQELGTRSYECYAQTTLARCLLHEQELPVEDIGKALERAESLVESTEGRGYLPFVFEMRARLADALDRKDEAKRHWQRTLDLFNELGAEGHLRRLERELRTSPG
jgi:class 3 adenylate cyclase/tetratricopeptide (TPR) repeat protein